MKATAIRRALSLVLAAAMACLALTGLAFVLSPGSGSTTLNDAFQVNSLTITDTLALTQSVRPYAELTDLSGENYSVNELMFFGLTITIYNPTKTLKHTSAVGNEYIVLVSSDSCDFSYSTVYDVVLTHPAGENTAPGVNLVSTENGVTKANAGPALTYDAEKNELKFVIKVWNDDPENANVNIGSDSYNLAINEAGSAEKAVYTIGFTGVNKAQKNGAVTAKVSPTEYTFKNNELTVTLNGRQYHIAKVSAAWPVKSDTGNWPEVVKDSLSTIGYRVSKVNADGSKTEIVTLDTEVTNAEGYGQSLGFSKAGRAIAEATVGGGYIYSDTAAPAFTAEEMKELELMMQDFGFSTKYSYKLQDKNFEQATTYKATLTAKYNVVDDEADVTPTPTATIRPTPSEIPEESPAPDETDPPEINPEPPKTGDAGGRGMAIACFALSGLCAAAFVLTLRRSKEK